MCLSVYKVFHINCLASLIAVLRGQQFINVAVSQFIEDHSEVLHRLRHVLSARNPTGTVLIIIVPISKQRKYLLMIYQRTPYSWVPPHLILPASLLFGIKSISLLLSSVNISKSHARAMQNAHKFWTLCKGCVGFHEVSESGSVISGLRCNPIDKWEYDEFGSGSYNYG